jgi:uroporphyrinogen-III decarboxylase
MTSRERLLRTIRRQAADRVPVNTYELCAYNSKSFENNEPSYARLMSLIRTHCDTATMWNPSGDGGLAMSAYKSGAETVTSRVESEKMTVYSHTVKTPSGRVLTWEDKVFDDVETVWHTKHICKDTDDVDAYLSIPFVPVTYDFSDYARVKAETGDHGIVMASLGDPACTAMEIMEFGEATVWAMTETDHFAETMDELHRRNMINLERMLQAGVVDLYRICGPEYITPPYLPPKYFERFVVPYVSDMTRLIHRYGGLVRIHSHGKIGKVLKMILECGADAIDPCEAPPDGDITLADVKKQAGDKLCIFGNLQLKLLEHGTPEDVRKAVKLCMDSAKEGGGYVIMPTASPINVPLLPKTYGNYESFILSALEYGSY